MNKWVRRHEEEEAYERNHASSFKTFITKHITHLGSHRSTPAGVMEVSLPRFKFLERNEDESS